MIDKRTLIKIAYWYYQVGMTQEQIAQKLHTSRQRVNKIVNSLIEDGIVSVTINGLENEYVVLENLIEQRFSLKQVIIADTEQNDLPSLSILGKKAGEFLDEFIQDGKKIGVTWGATLGETIQHMRPAQKNNCNVVQLVGGLNTTNHSIKPDEITRMLASKLGCDYSILYAPAIMNSELVKEIMAKEDFFIKAFERINGCDIAIVGIGQLSEAATIVNEGYLSKDELSMLLENGYVGDIAFNHYKMDGDFGTIHLQNRAMGVDIAMLQNIPTVVAIAGGESKANAVYGALKTGCIDILVIDSTIGHLLEKKLAAEK